MQTMQTRITRDEIIFDDFDTRYQKEVMCIFNYYVETSFAAYPENTLPESFFAKLQEMTRGYPAYVIKVGDEVAGFCFLRSYSPFSTFRESAEITYFIKQDFTGRGIGKIVLDRLESDALRLGIKNILASISSKNELSIWFHEKHGFKKCGQLEATGKKFGEYFDVIWMQKRISDGMTNVRNDPSPGPPLGGEGGR
jgi:L-amino acid N-acyltransferase YncA